MADSAPPVAVTLFVAEDRHRFEVSVGTSLKQVLDGIGYALSSLCGGRGQCGCCRMRIPSDSLSRASDLEQARLGPDLLAQGWRLACQTLILSDVNLALEPSRASWWSIDENDAVHSCAESPSEPSLNSHGIAVDLGTTHIRVSVLDRYSGRRLGARMGYNPQARFGADVLSRLSAAERPAVAEVLSKLVVQAIAEGISAISGQDLGLPLHADRFALVGNTAMLTLLTGTDGARLLDPGNWLLALECPVADPRAWKPQWQLADGAELQILQPLAGFVGSDLLADLLGCGLDQCTGPCLVIDVGTNTELALWDGQRAWITATPGGPAFEGVGISCGVPSGDGAVYRILGGEGPEDFRFFVMGEGKPLGLCGSALVDLVALLLNKGDLAPSGRFAKSVGPRGVPIAGLVGERFLKGSDVDALQRGKGAIAAAASCLLSQAGLAWPQIKTLYLCGAFGHHLHVPHAQAIGLLPALPGLKVQLVAGASLIGCERAMLDDGAMAFLESVRSTASLLNLAMLPEFDDRFIANLRLRPMSLGEAAPC